LEPFCRVDTILRIIGDRWTLGIIHELSAGPKRTLDLFNSFSGLSTKTMTDRLRRLERNGLITRISYKESPPRVEYSLTERGFRLLPVISSLGQAYSDLFEESTGIEGDVCEACSTKNGDSEDKHREPDAAAPTILDDRARPPRRDNSRNKKGRDIILL